MRLFLQLNRFGETLLRALHELLTNGSSAVNGCRQNDDLKLNALMMDLFLTNMQILTS